MKKTNEAKKLKDLLAKAYEALSGIVCEQGESGLARYCDTALLGKIADAIGLETGEDGVYYAVEYTAFTGKEWKKLGVKPQKKWGVCIDPRNPDKTWCLTGFSSKEEAETEFKRAVPEAVFREVA